MRQAGSGVALARRPDTLAGMTPADNDQPVVLSKIYTRTGDDGSTALGDMSRTRKTDPRLAAYADVEEANAAIGVALAIGDLAAPIVAVLGRIQNELFDVGADLCTPVVENPEFPPLRVEPSYVEWLEAQCDSFNADLKPLRSFILPGGSPGTALLHMARTVVRRAERTTWSALEAHDDVNPLTAKYLNRLSDLLFILCRISANAAELLWKPGATR
jgi:cob(I)alamin adenosyltransferase